MLSDTLNNEDASRSPCLTCPHRDMDKNNCALLCLRLAAYNSGEPWEGKPLPYIAKGRNKMENQRSEVRSQKSEIENPEGKPADENICVICHDLVKKVLNKRSQTCGACYQAWNTGKINHPTLGKFKPSLTKSKITKTKKPEVRSQKSEVKEAPGIVRESADQGEKIQVKIDLPETIARLKPGSLLHPLPEPITLYLELYPKIKSAVYDTAEKYFVTPEHVVIGLLGEALAGRNQKSEIRGQRSRLR